MLWQPILYHALTEVGGYLVLSFKLGWGGHVGSFAEIIPEDSAHEQFVVVNEPKIDTCCCLLYSVCLN